MSDFGLSRPLMESEYYKTDGSSRGNIPVKWTAPEALKWLKYSSQSGNLLQPLACILLLSLTSLLADVWAFGVVLWEIFSYGQAPYPGLSNSEVIQEVSKGYRMPPPENSPTEVLMAQLSCEMLLAHALPHVTPMKIMDLMKECWHEEPSKRPQWVEIFTKLAFLEQKCVGLSVLIS